MSLYSRRRMLALPLVLGACGFTPVYGTGGSGSKLRGQVLVEEPSSQVGFFLVRHLETTLGRSGPAPRFALDLDVVTDDEGLGIDATGDITRFNLLGKVEYALRDTTTGAIVTSGNVDNFTAYSALGTPVASLAAERDAVERLMVILGDQITARLFAADIPA